MQKNNFFEHTIIMSKKIIFLNLIIYLAFFTIIGRLFYLQIINREYYLEKLSSKKNKIIYEDTSLRGKIYDKNNVLLVDNKLVLTVVYQKEDGMSSLDEIKLAYTIAPKIELDFSKLTTSYLKDFYILKYDSEVEKRVSLEDKENLKKRKISI